MSAAASAVSAFDTWLDNRDRHNAGNLLVNEELPTGSIYWAYIDYAYSLAYGWGSGPAPPVGATVARYPVKAALDLTAVAETVQAIESMEDDAIRLITNRLSPDFIDVARAAIIAELEKFNLAPKDRFELALDYALGVAERTAAAGFPPIPATVASIARNALENGYLDVRANHATRK